MSFKEWTAVISILSAGVISGWVLQQAQAEPLTELSAVAMRLLWAIGAVIVLNIVAMIVFSILASIATGREVKDERADERDRAIAMRSMRNAYFVASIGGLGFLVLLAFGFAPALAVYALFGALMLAGVTDSVSRLVYYRLG